MARSKMITIRVDEAEHRLFKDAAAGVPVSISEYARDAMLARMALEQAPVSVPPNIPVSPVVPPVVVEPDPEPWVISEPTDVRKAVEYVRLSREFTPYSKEMQTGKAQKRQMAEPVPVCRHELLWCKVCGTG